jgi:hypothetical protein
MWCHTNSCHEESSVHCVQSLVPVTAVVFWATAHCGLLSKGDYQLFRETNRTPPPILSFGLCKFVMRGLVTDASENYRRGLDWRLDILTTYTHNTWLHFTDHCHIQTSVLSLVVSISRCLLTASNGGRYPYSGFPKYSCASTNSF